MDPEESNDSSKPLDLWMIRPCTVYNSEYSECTSISSRLHQLFVIGETIDCQKWFENHSNCLKWKKYKDLKAAEALIESEKTLRNNRWKSFYANNIWETRDNPPKDWNKPLPEYLAERRKTTTLKDTIDEYSTESDKFCSIM